MPLGEDDNANTEKTVWGHLSWNTKKLFALTKWLLVGYFGFSTSTLDIPGGMAGKKLTLLKYNFSQHINNLLLLVDI